MESRGHDAGDSGGLSVEEDLFADQGGVSTEGAAPQVVAEDEWKRRAGFAIAGIDPAADERRHAERGQERAGDEGGVDAQGLGSGAGQVGAAGLPRIDGLECLGELAEIAELRRGDPEAAQAGGAEGRELRIDTDEVLGLAVRERTQDDGIDYAEDRRGGADAKRETEEHGGGEGRRSAKLAQSEAGVLHQPGGGHGAMVYFRGPKRFGLKQVYRWKEQRARITWVAGAGRGGVRARR